MGLTIVETGADVQRILRIDDVERRVLGRRSKLFRRHLVQVGDDGRKRPGVVVQDAIENRRLIDHEGIDALAGRIDHLCVYRPGGQQHQPEQETLTPCHVPQS